MLTTGPRPRRPRAVVLAALAVVATVALAGCQRSAPPGAAEPLAPAYPSVTPAREPHPVATAQALAAMTIAAGLPGPVGEVFGNGDATGAWVSVDLERGSRRPVVVTSLVRTGDDQRPRSCTGGPTAPQLRVLWCSADDGEVRRVVAIRSGAQYLVAEVWQGDAVVTVDVSGLGDEAVPFARRLLSDPWFGHRTTPEAIVEGRRLEGFEEVDLYTSVEVAE